MVEAVAELAVEAVHDGAHGAADPHDVGRGMSVLVFGHPLRHPGEHGLRRGLAPRAESPRALADEPRHGKTIGPRPIVDLDGSGHLDEHLAVCVDGEAAEHVPQQGQIGRVPDDQEMRGLGYVAAVGAAHVDGTGASMCRSRAEAGDSSVMTAV